MELFWALPSPLESFSNLTLDIMAILGFKLIFSYKVAELIHCSGLELC